MLTTKPDGRRRYDVYSTMNPYDSTPTNYSINRVCFSCHVLPKGYDEDYPSASVYPGRTAFEMWDFGTTNSADVNRIKYDSITNKGYSFLAPDILGKSKDCNYCHNPHSSDSTRIHMVRNSVPLDLDRNSPNYGDKIESDKWFQEGFPATGVDFCLSKGCHVTNRFAKLGPRDPLYSDPSMKFWYKPYDQFNLLNYDEPGALTFSGMRPDSFIPDGVYETAHVSHHPIVPYNQFINTGNTLICLSCHVPHGSPGNTELSKVYRDTNFYESTYPQDNASLRRAYYRRINWWPVTFWKRNVPMDPSVRAMSIGRPPTYPNYYTDIYGNSQTFRYLAAFNNQANNLLDYRAKVGAQNVPLAGNDICFMCHPTENIIGKTGNPPTAYIGIDTTKTRFIGHEVVIGGAVIGETWINGMPGIGLNTVPPNVPNEFHKYTCSTCHGPHASTNEKLLTIKCFAQNKDNPVNNLSSRPWNRSEEHTSELQSHSFISYAVFCLKKKTI